MRSYFTFKEYSYNNNGFIESENYNCLSSAGLGFGISCSPLTQNKYQYKNGNLVSIKNLNKNEITLELIYDNGSNMPTSVIDNNTKLELSYTYFN